MHKTKTIKPLILIVEDSPEDYETTRRALMKSGHESTLVRCDNGDTALDYLHRRGQYSDLADTPLPNLILLDLNLPGTHGREVLVEIKSDHTLRAIPVVILTTSLDEQDINLCYQYGTNSYMQKPVGLDGFVMSIRQLTDYWFNLAVLPDNK